ncbi:MAG: hypothetical protein CM15mP79_0790 [Methanobacteriota archaeon]|nr:MAG: hypothetical protein CM15mP79_0790 [Euryarchaeota archaeon]
MQHQTPSVIRLEEGARVLFLTKDLELIRKQLYEGLNLRMEDLSVEDLLDDINTDVMTPAWVCFDHEPAEIAKNAYAGLMHEGKRVFEENALINGGFQVIVSGQRKGTGSSRETAAQCERWAGIRLVIAASFAPIHERNNINLGQLMGDHAMLERLQNGEELALEEFTSRYDPVTRLILEEGGLFPFAKRLAAGELNLPALTTPSRPMTMAEKIVARNLVGQPVGQCVKPHDPVIAGVQGGYSHEFTTAQVHTFLSEVYGEDYTLPNPDKFAVFEDHLLYADHNPRFIPFMHKVQVLRDLQKAFQIHAGVRDYSAVDGVSPGICHQVAREEFIEVGDFIQATDSHTCMGGASNALTYGVGATEYANLVSAGFTFVKVPESIRFELVGELHPGCTAKDVILYILADHAREELTLNRSMEFGGPGLASFPWTSAPPCATWPQNAAPAPASARPTSCSTPGWASACRTSTSTRSAPWRSLLTRARSTTVACTSSTSTPSNPWSLIPATPIAASPQTRPTAPTWRTSTRSPSTSPTAARARPARKTTSPTTPRCARRPKRPA